MSIKIVTNLPLLLLLNNFYDFSNSAPKLVALSNTFLTSVQLSISLNAHLTISGISF